MRCTIRHRSSRPPTGVGAELPRGAPSTMKLNKLAAVGATSHSPSDPSSASALRHPPSRSRSTRSAPRRTPYPSTSGSSATPRRQRSRADPGRHRPDHPRTEPAPLRPVDHECRHGAEFTDLIDGASFEATGPLTFQVPVFFDLDGRATSIARSPPFARLAPARRKRRDAVDLQPDVRRLGLVANTPVPFSDIVAAFDAAIGRRSPEILAFGVLREPGRIRCAAAA